MAIDVEKFFDAVNNIAGRKVSSTPIDLTVNAKVKMVYNVDTGEYKVEYQGNTFSAFSQNPTIVYSKGERVYVLVPQGNFSEKKIILGRSANDSNITYQQQQDMTNFYIDKGPNWLDLYQKGHDDPLQICAVPTAERYSLQHDKGANWQDFSFYRSIPDQMEGTTRYPTHWMTEEELAEADEQLQLYAQNYTYIKLEAEFKTEFLMTHSIGQYSLLVEVLADNPRYVPPSHPQYDENEPEFEILPFELGFAQFSGAPYQYSVYTPQKAYYEIPVNTIRGLARISLYQNGEFLCDMRSKYNDNGEQVFEEDQAIKDTNNIFCQNIDIRFAQKINLTETLYYCWIETPKGDKLYDSDAGTDNPQHPVGKEEVNLIAHLQYGYEDLVEEGVCEVHWFREKYNILTSTPTDEEIESYGCNWTDWTGPGWIPIELLMEDGYGYYDVNYNELLIRKEAVPWKWRYKVVVVYKENTVVSAVQDITRFDSDYNLAIEQFTSTDSKRTLLRIDNLNKSVHSTDPNTNEGYREWFGTWYLLLQDGSYARVSDPFHFGPLDITRYMQNEVMTFRVMCYDPYQVDPENTGVALYQYEEVGNLEHTIITSTDADVLVDWVGTDTFNYDALGSAYPWIGEQEYTLQPRLTWAAGSGADYRIEILAPDGFVLGDRNYHSEGEDLLNGYSANDKSMMYDMWVDMENVIHFRVREKYDEEKAKPENNTFTVRIVTLKKETYETSKNTVFIKDGQSGTQGSDWIAPVYPCNYKTYEQTKEEIKDGITYTRNVSHVKFTERRRGAVPLVLIPDGNGGYKQDDNFRVFIRPFVQKNGKALEAMPKTEGYFYRVWWDVRFSQNANDERVKNASHLRLYHPDGTIFLYNDQGKFYQLGGKSPGETNPPLEDGMQGYSQYPSKAIIDPDASLDDEGIVVENYGAVEVRFEPQENLPFDATQFGFVVKAQIDIFTGAWDPNTNQINPDINNEDKRKVATIYAWYPVDVFFNNDNKEFHTEYVYCNWPTHVVYNATGYDPDVNNYELKFYYGDTASQVEYGSSPKLDAENLTPYIQYVDNDEVPLTNQTVTDKTAYRQIQLYRPKEHIDWQVGMIGALRTITTNSPFGSGFYVRNQIMTLNQYGNVDANAWDGQSISIDEESGSIFAPTVGAGYKDPFTNTFTGVIMGIDKSQTKEGWGNRQGFDSDDIKQNPYMAGLYGYQKGYCSFGIMENGTAFFGRADRGGRIIIDGYNATIYGGANGIMESPTIGDEMWNAMRLTFVDLTHAANNEDDMDMDNGASTGTDGINQGFNNAYYGMEAWAGTDRGLPDWYALVWRNAYILPKNSTPYFIADTSKKYADLPSYIDEYKKLAASLEDPTPDAIYDQLPKTDNYAINYYDMSAMEWLTDVNDSAAIPEETRQRTGFGPNRASTTPAIEIGQHIRGLMPGILDWDTYEDVFKELWIPGNRNFLVTYDGTLWAMNGVFMGNVIGSNIIGGRIQGTEIGIGRENEGAADYSYQAVVQKDDWPELCAPVQDWYDWTAHGEEPPPTAFYVSSDGVVSAKKINIYGGRINIGSFHILGKDDFDGGEEEKVQGEGYLVQFGESDFIGPTHFYGNVGIGPNIREGYGNIKGSNYGNLFQTYGQVALGIIYEDGDLDFHQVPSATTDMGSRNPIKYNYNYWRSENKETNYTSQGSPGEMKEGSIQEAAIFGLDIATPAIPSRENNARYQGHFWPMTFVYSQVSTSPVGEDAASTKGVAGYFTTMDLFYNQIGPTVSSGSYGGNLTMTNYFRAGPWGPEANLLWIRKGFQTEDSCVKPVLNKADEQASGDNTVGWMGLVNRAGSASTTLNTEFALGMQSTKLSPIILFSDSELALRARNTFQVNVASLKDSGDSEPGKDPTNGDYTLTSYLANGCRFTMGEIWNGGTSNTKEKAIRPINLEAAKGRITVQVLDKDILVNGYFGRASTESACGIDIDPENRAGQAETFGIFVYTRKGDTHLVRYNTNGGACSEEKEHTELLLQETSATLYAKEQVIIAWGPGKSAHSKKFNHAAIFKDDGISVVNEDDTTQQPYPEPDPGTSGGGGTPPEPAQPGEEKYCIYLGQTDNASNNSEITWQKQFISIASNQVWISGGGSPAHNPTNFMLFAQSSVDMRGDYAVPENQFHIYARFA